MKKILIYKDKIEILEEKKKFLSKKLKTNIETYNICDIESVQKDLYEGKTCAIEVLCKEYSEFYVDEDEVESILEIEKLYDFLLENANKYLYEVQTFDIDTCETIKIKENQKNE